MAVVIPGEAQHPMAGAGLGITVEPFGGAAGRSGIAGLATGVAAAGWSS
jgi:hypothetical protein